MRSLIDLVARADPTFLVSGSALSSMALGGLIGWPFGSAANGAVIALGLAMTILFVAGFRVDRRRRELGLYKGNPALAKPVLVASLLLLLVTLAVSLFAGLTN